MFDVRSAFNKQRAVQAYIEHDAVSKCATDYAGTLMFMSLHDKFNFGTKRLAKIVEEFEKLGEYEKGFLHDWKDYIIKKGVNYVLLEKTAIDLARYICSAKENRRHLEETANLVAASFIIIMYCTTKIYKWGGDRLQRLLDYVKDEVYVVKKKEVSIMEFMECLNIECNVENEILDEYKKENKIKIIPIYGDYGGKWFKYD